MALDAFHLVGAVKRQRLKPSRHDQADSSGGKGGRVCYRSLSELLSICGRRLSGSSTKARDLSRQRHNHVDFVAESAILKAQYDFRVTAGES